LSKKKTTPTIESRKDDHLVLCSTEKVAFKSKSNLLEEVEFVHNALPELSLNDINLGTNWAGKQLKAPIIIAAMTGGIGKAEEINRDLAQIACELGLGFGFGSMRPLLLDSAALGYQVRDIAPDTLIIGNIGVVQAREVGAAKVQSLVDQTGVGAMVVHLNPSMEVVQFEGDVDFRGGLSTIESLISKLSVPVIVKETGCGLSHNVGKRLVDIGVQFVDCSGAGGTSWVGVEALRDRADSAGDTFWDWGIPTAGSLLQLSPLPLKVCATGGIKNGLDVARSLALGASCAGIARPVLQAWVSGGKDMAREYLLRVIREVKIAMLLTGSRDVLALQNSSTIIGKELSKWTP